MLRFFRKIRQHLLSEAKVRMYLKYAAGEIVLVVIGILIALQINNWNEDHKNDQKEELILNELLYSINKDLNAYSRYLEPRIERKNDGLDSLYFYIFQNEGIEDSLFIKFFNRSSQDIYLRFDNGPFEALKSSGLDIIKNDSLRSKINNAYTVALPLYSYFSNDHYNETRMRIADLKPRFIGLERIYRSDNNNYLRSSVKVDDILNNEDFLQIYKFEMQKWREYTSRLEQMRESLKDVKSAIENELGK